MSNSTLNVLRMRQSRIRSCWGTLDVMTKTQWLCEQRKFMRTLWNSVWVSSTLAGTRAIEIGVEGLIDDAKTFSGEDCVGSWQGFRCGGLSVSWRQRSCGKPQRDKLRNVAASRVKDTLEEY